MTFKLSGRTAEVPPEVLKKVRVIIVAQLFGHIVGFISGILHHSPGLLHLGHGYIGYVSSSCLLFEFFAEIGVGQTQSFTDHSEGQLLLQMTVNKADCLLNKRRILFHFPADSLKLP